MSVSKQHDSPILNAFKHHLHSSHNCDIDDNIPVYKPDDGDTDDTSLLFLYQSLASPIRIQTVNPGKDIKPSKDKYCISTCIRKHCTWYFTVLALERKMTIAFGTVFLVVTSLP